MFLTRITQYKLLEVALDSFFSTLTKNITVFDVHKLVGLKLKCIKDPGTGVEYTYAVITDAYYKKNDFLYIDFTYEFALNVGYFYRKESEGGGHVRDVPLDGVILFE